ncbi:MAG: SUMF1/EgtB/PvdO family nonheme iron enzyme [Candidatus Eisenbacteria bacterium]|nr:SUMF1/EgtB/PvdO family nonheme iron enzyme [Candidatus Eisenbacteria bacterium]
MRSSTLIAAGLCSCLFVLPCPAEPGFALVPAAAFTAGDPEAVCGSSMREVTLTRDYWFATTEVTNAEFVDRLQAAYDAGWVAVEGTRVRDTTGSGATLCELGTWYAELQFADGVFSVREAPYALINAYPGGYTPASHPVVRVTWFGAAAYCNWRSIEEGLPPAYDPFTWECNGGDPYGAVGYRLPMDAESEWAGRFPDGRNHPWGDDPADCTRANHSTGTNYCRGWTAPVGSFPAGVSALGIYDLGGNVGEWCNDYWVCVAPTDPVIDPLGPPTGTKKVLHGGGWFYGAPYTRCATRDADDPDFGYEGQGFRIARTALAPAQVSGAGGGRGGELRLLTHPVRGGEGLRLRLPSERGERAELQVYDVSGRGLSRITVAPHVETVTLATRDLVPGRYWVRLAGPTPDSLRPAAISFVVVR